MTRKTKTHSETGQSVRGGDVVLGFGRHKGKKLSQVSDNYLVWCIKNMESGTATWHMMKGEIKRRDDLDAARGRCGRVSRCPENERAENRQDTSFIVLTGPKATVSRPDSEAGEMSPFGIRYPSDWNKLTKGQKKAWRKHAAGLQKASKPKDPVNLADRVKSKQRGNTALPVKPAIPSPMDLADQQKRANVAMAAKTIRQPTEPIQAEECPY